MPEHALVNGPVRAHPCHQVRAYQPDVQDIAAPHVDVNRTRLKGVPAASGPLTPAAGPSPSERRLAQQLASTLSRRCGAFRAAQGVRLFLIDPGLRRTVPDPALRAASASLQCTFGEPAIAALRSGTVFARARFANLPPASIAQVGPPGPGETLPNILFNQRYRFEDFRQLGPSVFHPRTPTPATRRS
ncbi:hypothetical protein [Streptomyces sp. NPDC012888]|uniref:hypothetical protein n=1 Tax=Streptomyces sp. NPDC012888 TaxID=3364855 RepID=UPI0036BDD61E